MKQLLILSGKGGTGKTTLASAFISLSNAKAYADCDVDAPNLHLISGKAKYETTEFFGLPKAYIDEMLCIECSLCIKMCKFDAISKINFTVDKFACEGCGVCEVVCPVNAITLLPEASGDLKLYKEDEVLFSTAELKMGSGNSGKLVTEVKRQLNQSKAQFAIIDGSPGIGCPVIASLSGVDMALIVAEPSVSGISDMERIIKTALLFKVRTAVCVNKYDINFDNTRKIEAFCADNQINYLGRIPYDVNAINAINNGKSIVEIECVAGSAVREVYKKAMAIFNNI